MAQSNREVPFTQTNLGATVIGGIILLGLSILINALIDGSPVIARVAVVLGATVLGLLAASIASARWRARTWISLGRWLRGLDVLTNKRREAIRQEGYEARSAEIEQERAIVRQPAWRFEARDALGERDLFWLHNHGYGATDVHVSCDPEFFTTDGDVFFRDFGNSGGGGSTGKWFKGYPTKRGLKEGVIFTVRWRDTNGDAHQKEVFLPPIELESAQERALREAHMKGKAEGAREARAESATKLPTPAPRWTLTALDRSGSRRTWHLRNLIRESVVNHVRVDVEPAGAFIHEDGAFWTVFDEATDGTFSGRVTDYGARKGFEITVWWKDAEGESFFRTWTEPPSPEKDEEPDLSDVWDTPS